MEIKTNRTARGFELLEFVDRYGSKCSLQKSSLAEDHAIWLGIDDAKPMVLHGDAKHLGIDTEATSGWVPYPIPKEVQLATRMHLTREQVKALLPILQEFVRSGEVTNIAHKEDKPKGPLGDIDHNKVRGYLIRKGWERAGQIESLATVWHRPERQHESFEIVLPSKSSLRDYSGRMSDLAVELSKYEGRPVQDVIATLRELQE